MVPFRTPINPASQSSQSSQSSHFVTTWQDQLTKIFLSWNSKLFLTHSLPWNKWLNLWTWWLIGNLRECNKFSFNFLLNYNFLNLSIITQLLITQEPLLITKSHFNLELCDLLTGQLRSSFDRVGGIILFIGTMLRLKWIVSWYTSFGRPSRLQGSNNNKMINLLCRTVINKYLLLLYQYQFITSTT